jgi:hypothetical protein
MRVLIINILDNYLIIEVIFTMTLNWCSLVNCEAELLVTCSLTSGMQNQIRQEPCEGVETDLRTKLGKEIVAGAHRRLTLAPYYSGQADSGMLRLCSGSLRLAHPRLRLKRQLLTSRD